MNQSDSLWTYLKGGQSATYLLGCLLSLISCHIHSYTVHYIPPPPRPKAHSRAHNNKSVPLQHPPCSTLSSGSVTGSKAARAAWSFRRPTESLAIQPQQLFPEQHLDIDWFKCRKMKPQSPQQRLEKQTMFNYYAYVIKYTVGCGMFVWDESCYLSIFHQHITPINSCVRVRHWSRTTTTTTVSLIAHMFPPGNGYLAPLLMAPWMSAHVLAKCSRRTWDKK